ncbi:MAG TPA: cyclic nucleotide-binding domain-containing protein [Alphaproteobacteria bacterium]|nr:cyclic nucleotide-binding domain-containing protein [Alphaproteobacteria bacterium]
MKKSAAASRFSVNSATKTHSLHLVHPCDVCDVRPYSACAALNPDEQSRLVDIMTTVEVDAHQPIFDEAERAQHVFNVTEGAVKIYKLLSDGRRQITGFLFPGDFLGLTHNENYAYSAEALTHTKLCRFSRQKLEALLDEMPKLEQRLLGMASHELAAAQDQMILLGRKSAKERVVSFLIMLSNAAVRHGRPDNPVGLPMTRNDMGDYLGLSLETVSRALTQLKTQGLIQLLDERRVRLAKPEAMREIAGGV